MKKYNSESGAKIQDFHALRPIPQRQIDAVTSGENSHKILDINNFKWLKFSFRGVCYTSLIFYKQYIIITFTFLDKSVYH